MPEQICTQCAEKAVEMYIFKQNCERADTALRQQLGKSPFVDHCHGEEQMQYCLENDNEFDISEGSENIIVKPEINLENDDGSSLESTVLDSSVQIYRYNRTDHVYSDAVVCNVCDKKFKSNEELNKHRKVHIPKPFVCETCGKSFTRDDLLLRHKIIHAIKMQEKNKSVVVDTAATILDDDDVDDDNDDDDDDDDDEDDNEEHAAANHKQSDENDLKKQETMLENKAEHNSCNQCTICNKRFSKVAHLNRHIKIHAAIKPYICELCNKGFARAEQLMNHMNAHSGIKPHVCKICSKGKYLT